MKEIGAKTDLMSLVLTHTMMDEFTSVIGILVKKKALELTHGQMVENTKDIGQMTRCMDLAHFYG